MWFGVHFPALGIEVFERRQPAGAATPTVLMEDGRVLMTNAAAHAAGVMPGSSLATALGIVGHLKHFERDADSERKRLRQLAEAAYRHTPCVSLSEPDSLVLDIGASLKLFGGVAALANQLDALFVRLSHVSRIAFATTPAAALALAHADEAFDLANIPNDGQGLARAIADSREALRRTPLRCAALEARDIESLADMGIFNIGQLLDLPRDELGARFGPALQNQLARLIGAAPDPRPPIKPRERFAGAIHLVESVSDKAALRFPMRRLAVELEAWLQARQLGAVRLAWRFEPLHPREEPVPRARHPARGSSPRLAIQREAGPLHPPHSPSFARGKPLALPGSNHDYSGSDGVAHVEARFATARDDAKGFMEVSWLKLEGASLPDDVMSIVLNAVEVAPLTASSDGLLAPAAATASPDAPLKLVDTLTARLGEGALQGLAAVDDHRPEFAWAPRPPGIAWQARADAVPSAPRRPLWLLDAPRPVDGAGLKLLSGPERIESGWWSSPVARDYYVATAANGAQCWVFRERAPADAAAERGTVAQSWFLHGYFA